MKNIIKYCKEKILICLFTYIHIFAIFSLAIKKNNLLKIFFYNKCLYYKSNKMST